MSRRDYFVTVLVNGTVVIWLPYRHSDLRMDQIVKIQKKILHLHILREDRRSHHEPTYHVHKGVTSGMPIMATTLG